MDETLDLILQKEKRHGCGNTNTAGSKQLLPGSESQMCAGSGI
jgi:hypothetical protein